MAERVVFGGQWINLDCKYVDEQKAYYCSNLGGQGIKLTSLGTKFNSIHFKGDHEMTSKNGTSQIQMNESYCMATKEGDGYGLECYDNKGLFDIAFKMAEITNKEPVKLYDR